MHPTDQQIITEIINSTAFRKVSIAIDFEPVLDEKNIAGNAQAWVIELKTNAKQNTRDMGSPVQIEEQFFAVIIGVKKVNDSDGAKTTKLLKDKRLAVRQSLFGFIPKTLNDSYTPLVLAGSRLLKIKDGLTFWAEIFATTHQIDSENLI